MKPFIAKFVDRVGILCGFDLLVMRGELRALCNANGGIEQYLRSSQVMFKDFRRHVPEASRGLHRFPAKLISDLQATAA